MSCKLARLSCAALRRISTSRGQKVWRATGAAATTGGGNTEGATTNEAATTTKAKPEVNAFRNDEINVNNVESEWHTSVKQVQGEDAIVRRVSFEESKGQRHERQLGVLREDPSEDMRELMYNYTVPALASALRDREETLQYCAGLLASGQLSQLQQVLKPFEPRFVELRRYKNKHLDVSKGWDYVALELLRKGLARMSRQITHAHQKRAGVVLPLCNVDGVACIVFSKRSSHMRSHPNQVCLPGGMVSIGDDKSIVVTCLREMEEEIGLPQHSVTVLGTLRCNWAEIARMTGMAVTPVVGFVGDLDDSKLVLNYDEVAECFTVPISTLLNKSQWIHREDCAPIFIGGPYMIWGLTGYFVDRFIKDILGRYTVTTELHSDDIDS